MATKHVEIVMASHCNGANRLFGGQLMSWIDVTGAVEARRHCKNLVTLKVVDNLNFLSPVYMDETVVLEAKLTRTGTTSMEVKVCTYVEKISGERKLINIAYLIFVAIDDDGRPVPVIPFTPTTYAEKAEHQAALERDRIRKEKKNDKI